MVSKEKPDVGGMEDLAYSWVIKNNYDGDEDAWDDYGWGFFSELSMKNSNEKIFEGLEGDFIQLDVSSDYKHYSKIVELCEDWCDVFFNAKGEEVEKVEWRKLIDTMPTNFLSICECLPD
jgi:hypothetical protein|tara:strand:+ start:387 stop:746 length:360 start_codon:yes stop_codon:yes gene_type:complete